MYFRKDIFTIIVFLVQFLSVGTGDFCFRTRISDGGRFGKCHGRIGNTPTAADCCTAGGAGWTVKRNGKRCGPACFHRNEAIVHLGNKPTTQSPAEALPGWGPWENAGACTATCYTDEGPIFRQLKRECNNPAPVHDRHYCIGPSIKMVRCSHLPPCPVNGGWSEYRDWSECSKTCGEGIRIRRRTCNNPRPQYGGIFCEGSDTEHQTCSERQCPVIHGGWSKWMDWGQCSVTCGEGRQTRLRTCDNPAPENGGKNCVGKNIRKSVCHKGPCSIHGGWGPWKEAGECSATCYTEGRLAYRKMKRECDNPLPMYGGDDCVGESVKLVRCAFIPPCPVNGGWSNYGAWSECSKTCEEGIRIRKRTCTNPPPMFGGISCKGRDTEQQTCLLQKHCPVHGGWSEWGAWSLCSAITCGVEGTMFRSRTCTNPIPIHMGRYCSGKVIERESCFKCQGDESDSGEKDVTGEGSGCSVGSSGSGDGSTGDNFNPLNCLKLEEARGDGSTTSYSYSVFDDDTVAATQQYEIVENVDDQFTFDEDDYVGREGDKQDVSHTGEENSGGEDSYSYSFSDGVGDAGQDDKNEEYSYSYSV